MSQTGRLQLQKQFNGTDMKLLQLSIDFIIKVLPPVVNVVLVMVTRITHGVDVLQNVGVVHVDHLVHTFAIIYPHTSTIRRLGVMTQVIV